MKNSLILYVRGAMLLVMGILLGNYVQAQWTPTGAAPNTSTNSPLAVTINNVYVGASSVVNGHNTAVGFINGVGAPLFANTSGLHNTAYGEGTLQALTSSSFNTAVGGSALIALTGSTNADNNTAVGYSSMSKFTNGYSNSAFGASALGSASVSPFPTGIRNSAFGTQSLEKINGTASQNCAFGHLALSNVTSGSGNLGLGYNVQVESNTSNNQLSIQNVIYGRSMGTLGSGNVAIGGYPVSTTTGGIASNSTSGLGTGSYVRLQVAGTLGVLNVPNATNTIGKYLFVDANGVVNQAPLPTLGCTTAYSVPVSNGSSYTCSQITDNTTNGTDGTVQIGTGTFGTVQWNAGTATGVGQGTPIGWITGSYQNGIQDYKLVVGGMVRALSYISTSDERLKTDIKKIKDPLSALKKLNGYTYNWDNNNFAKIKLDDTRQSGFLAQEVLKAIPEAVVINNDGVYGVNYNAIMPLLAEGIKTQQTQIEKLSLENEEFKSQIEELKTKLNLLTPGDVKLKVNSIEVVPNPITGISLVSYKLDNPVAASFLIITDLQGRIIKQISLVKNLSQGQVQISKKDIPAGMYVFAIVSGNTEIQSKKVLVTE